MAENTETEVTDIEKTLRENERSEGLEMTARFVSMTGGARVRSSEIEYIGSPYKIRYMFILLQQILSFFIHLPCMFTHLLACKRSCRGRRRRASIEPFSSELESELTVDTTLSYDSVSNGYFQEYQRPPKLECFSMQKAAEELKAICLSDDVCSIMMWLGLSPDILELDLGEGLPVLHEAILCGSKGVAEKIIADGPMKLLWTDGKGKRFKGCFPIHLAVVSKQMNLVNAILKRVSDSDRYQMLHSIAMGSVLREAQLPLHIALVNEDEEMLDLLVSFGCELDRKDARGYNVMHFLASQCKNESKEEGVCKMFELVLKRLGKWREKSRKIEKSKADQGKSIQLAQLLLLFKNHDNNGFTPLRLACKMGGKDIVQRILSLNGVYRFPHHHLSSQGVAFYDMSEIDPLLSQFGKHPSVLEAVAMLYRDRTLDCLTIPPIKALLEHKWARHRLHYVAWGLFHLAFIIFFSLNILPRRGTEGTAMGIDPNQSLAAGDPPARFRITNTDYVIMGISIFYLVFGVFVCLSIVRISRRLGMGCIDTLWMFNTLMAENMVVFGATTLAYCLCKITRHEAKLVLLSTSLLLGWMHMILFTKSFRATGFFSIMYHKILLGDILRFMIIIIIIILAFAMAAFTLFSDNLFPPAEFDDINSTMMAFFKLALGLSEFKALNTSYYNTYCRLLFIAFVVLCNILLMNMLIATMTDTFTLISKNATLMCLKLRTSDILMIEWILPVCLQLSPPRAWERRIQQVALPGGKIYKRYVYLMEVSDQ